MEYLTTIMGRHSVAPKGMALVVGGGRGILPRGLARLGLDVLAIDPAESATRLAQQTTSSEGLAIVHRTAPAYDLDIADSSCALVYYADTFEIIPDLDRVIKEAARVLAPGGLLFYDTVNRTVLSRLIYLVAFQRVRMTRIMPAGYYVASRLRTPAEVCDRLSRHGLHNEEFREFTPRNLQSLVKAILARKRGDIDDGQVAAMVSFILSPPGRHPRVTYLGYARKPVVPQTPYQQKS